MELFTKKIFKKLLKIWSWAPGSEIRKKPILDPGSRGQKGTGSRIRIRNTGDNIQQISVTSVVDPDLNPDTTFQDVQMEPDSDPAL
jgi:hypothetical protein